MSALADFFLHNIPEVYFFYGLSFFSMGLTVFVEISHSSELDFARALRPLAVFGLLHGSHEWFEMFLLLHPEIAIGPASLWISIFRIVMLAVSFIMLLAFGVRLITASRQTRLYLQTLSAATLVWGLGLLWLMVYEPQGDGRIVAADVYTRYSLAIPGAILTAWGLVLQRQRFIRSGMGSFGRDVALAALAFLLYGVIGQLFASSSNIFPSNFLNAERFLRWFGFPIQVFRAAMACVAAIFIIRSLRSFEEETKRRIETLREAQLAERRRLETVRSELLHRTVKAQEAERQRIARELHDETGQTLTALGLGLRGLSETVQNNPERAVQQAKKLEGVAVTGLEELQRLVSGLHPSQLDDLGLPAALRWYAGEITRRFGLQVTFTSQGSATEIPPDIRVVYFRIAQEAVTNIVRHANARRVSIMLVCDTSDVRLRIEDDGQGFDVDETLDSNNPARPNWGLLGMLERAALIGGECQIFSAPGQGTLVEVVWKWESAYAENPSAPGG